MLKACSLAARIISKVGLLLHVCVTNLAFTDVLSRSNARNFIMLKP